MAVKATCIDDAQIVHLLIGLNRENIDSLLRGETLTLPPGAVALSDGSEIVIVLAETDEELVERSLPHTGGPGFAQATVSPPAKRLKGGLTS
jgi:hypothetical protein